MAKLFDYTTKDYQGFKQDMIDLIPKIMPEWTDHSPNDPGIVLLELLAYQLEKNSYYIDRVANEIFLSTATQRKSVINHCRLIGYELGWYKSARHYQVFEIEPQPEDTVIPAGFQVGTVGSAVEEPVIFETLEDLVIPAGATGLEQDTEGNYLYQVEVEHGQTIEDEFIGTVETEDQDQAFRLQYSPVLRESISVIVEEDSGAYNWENVEDFVSSTANDRHYTVEMDENDWVSIRFGTGVSGRIPKPPASVFASYKVGGGEIGNVGANTIIEFYDSVPGLVSTTNPFDPHVRGEDKESIEHAKVFGPASLRTLDRYVTPTDYEDGILLDVPEIEKAKAINVDGDVHLYLLSGSGTAVTQGIKDKAIEIINQKKMMFTDVTLKDPIFVPIDISVNLIIQSSYDDVMIRYSAENMIQDLFRVENLEFGNDFTISQIHSALFGIEGVRNVIVNAPTTDKPIADNEIMQLGNLTVLVDGK